MRPRRAGPCRSALGFHGEEQGSKGRRALLFAARISTRAIAGMIQNDIMASIIGLRIPTRHPFRIRPGSIFATDPEEGKHRQLQRYLKAIGDLYVPVQTLVMIPAQDRPNAGAITSRSSTTVFTSIRFLEYLEELSKQHTALGDTLGNHLSTSYCGVMPN